MSVKVSGAEWKRYYDDKVAWPEEAYHDDTVILVDGKLPGDDFDLGEVADTAVLEVQNGFVIFPDGRDEDLQDHFERWRIGQSEVFCVFRAPKNALEAIRTAIVAAGGTVCDA
jgi:hypothetical protein